MAGMTDAVENKVLNHLFGKTTYTVTAPVYLALCTVAVLETDTAATITEANYTGYARKAIQASDMASASGGSITNTNTLTFAACTATPSGPQTVIGFAICTSASGAGDIVFFGTLPAATISTAQTPATVPVGGLVCTQD